MSTAKRTPAPATRAALELDRLSAAGVSIDAARHTLELLHDRLELEPNDMREVPDVVITVANLLRDASERLHKVVDGGAA